jgi:hypothetical protein
MSSTNKHHDRLIENINLIITYSKDKLLSKIKELENFINISEKNQYLSKIYKLVFNAKCINNSITTEEVIKLKDQGRISDKEVTKSKPANIIPFIINKTVQGVYNYKTDNNPPLPDVPKPGLTIQDSYLADNPMSLVKPVHRALAQPIIPMSESRAIAGPEIPNVSHKASNKEYLQRKKQREENDPLDVSTFRDYKGEFIRNQRKVIHMEQPSQDGIKPDEIKQNNVISKPAVISQGGITVLKSEPKTDLMPLVPSKSKTKRSTGFTFNPEFYKNVNEDKSKKMQNEFKNFLSEIDKP